MMTGRTLSCILMLVLWCASCAGKRPAPLPYAPQEGDVYFQSLPHQPLVDAIEGSTDSPFSHCGILHKAGSDWVVIEALGTVKETPLATWINQARDGQYTVFRLKEKYRSKIPEFVQAAQGFKGRPYDIHYDMDDAAIYCSELVYKAVWKTAGEAMGQTEALGTLRWQPFEGLIRRIEGGNLPLERVMITPRRLSEAGQLERVFPPGT